jgi:hypothetical protein
LFGFFTVAGVERNNRAMQKRGQFLYAHRTTWWTFIDGIARCDRFRVRMATVIAAFSALRLRQNRVDLFDEGQIHTGD